MRGFESYRDPTRRDLGRYRVMGWDTALLIGAVVAAAASTAVTVVTATQAADAAEEAGQYNARLAEQQAAQARDAAALEEEAYRAHAKRVQAANRASIGASGVTTEGSPLLVLMDNAAQAEYEAQRIRYGGAIQAEGLRQRGDLLRFEGGAATRNLPGVYAGAGVSLLGATTRAGGGYYNSLPKNYNTSLPAGYPYGP